MDEALLRAEREWSGGVDPDRVGRDLTARLDMLQRRRDEHFPAEDVGEPRSVAQAVARAAKLTDVAKDVVEVQRLVGLYLRTLKPKPEPDDVKKLEADTKPFLESFGGRPLDLARTALEAAVESPPSREQFQFLAGLLNRGSVPSYEETRWLKQLAAEVPSDRRGGWRAEGAQLALQARREAATAAAADPRALSWVRKALDDARSGREEGEKLLFDMDKTARDRATAALRRPGAYRRINRDLQTIQEGQRSRDEALVLLPAYAPYLEVDPSNDEAWEKAVATARSLRDALSVPVEGAEGAARLRRVSEFTDALRHDPDGRQRLRHPLEPEALQRLINRRRQADLADEKIMRGLLQTPWPAVGERIRLWSAWRDLGAALRLREGAAPPSWSGESIKALPPSAPGRAAGAAIHRGSEVARRRETGQTGRSLRPGGPDADRRGKDARPGGGAAPGMDEEIRTGEPRALESVPLWHGHDCDPCRLVRQVKVVIG